MSIFFLNFHYNLPLEKRVLFHINKLSQPRMLIDKFGSNYPSGFGEKKFKFRERIFAVSLLSALALSQVWLKLPRWLWRRRFFLLSIFAVSLLSPVIISPWKKRPFIWTNLKPLHPRVRCSKFSWKWPSGVGEKTF